MKKIDYSKANFIVSGLEGFNLTQAMRLWKTKYDDIKDFYKEVITHPSMEDFGQMMEESWDNIQPYTVEDALSQENAEVRRTYFECLGVQRLFQQLNPKLRDRQVIKKKRRRWDDKNDPYDYEFEDVYELYEIQGKKLFKADRWGREPLPVFAVRCWCTTTEREYWLYVNEEAAVNERWYDPRKAEQYSYDAIRAIAWTIRLDVSDPEKIYRQGDIIVTKMTEKSAVVSPYHITKDQYLSLMYSET